MVGQRFSHFEILEKLGEGGMGVVYRARDTRLNREVALKVLRDKYASDRDRMERFEREARLLASLNHPNIASIHGLEQEGGVSALVMELAEGPTLAQRIARGAVPLEEALPLAHQLAAALEYAHNHGVVHRDLKPSNIKITSEGTVKVLDFGLAQAIGGESTLAATAEDTPTQTIDPEEVGVVVGTATYMSPEQARGRAVDKRTDIWAFGVVLYEMLTGKALFAADTVSDTLAAVLTKEPDLEEVPPQARRIVQKCLVKDPKDRLRDIGDIWIVSEPPPAPRASEPTRASRLGWIVAAVACLAFAALILTHFGQTAPQARLRRLAVNPPVSVTGAPVISPDGAHIAFVEEGARGRLWIQDLDQQQARVIEGTEGAQLPFWSPDSASLGFGISGELRRVPASGGAATRVAAIEGDYAGGTWSPDNEWIVFASGGVLRQVSARGGTPEVVVSPSEAESGDTPIGVLQAPHFLPAEAGARVVAYTYGAGATTSMMVEDLDSGEKHPLGEGRFGAYAPSGYIVYQTYQQRPITWDLWAVPFSLDTLERSGDAFPVAQDALGTSVASDGTLVYLDTYISGPQQLVWLDRGGNPIGEIGEPFEDIGDPALSPNEQRIAFWGSQAGNWDLYVWDIARGTKTSLSPSPANEIRPNWSPNGQQVAFSSTGTGGSDIFVQQSDGAAPRAAVAESPQNEFVGDWSSDGRYIVYQRNDPKNGWDLWYLERSGNGWREHPFLEAAGQQRAPKLSPNGRYVAYLSDEAGRYDVYVRRFPQGDRQWTVSSNGGLGIRWSRDGTELYYVEGGDTLMAVPVNTESAEFTAGVAAPLFRHPAFITGSYYPRYDVSRDGNFLTAETVGWETRQPSIRVIENWAAEFRGSPETR